MAEYPAKRNPHRCPTHPGALLREEAIPVVRDQRGRICRGRTRSTLSAGGCRLLSRGRGCGGDQDGCGDRGSGGQAGEEASSHDFSMELCAGEQSEH